MFVLAAISGIASAAFASQNTPEYFRPFVFGYCVVFEVVLAIAFVVTLFRLNRGKKGLLVANLIASLLVLAFVIALLLPAVPSAREAARRTQCVNNLKQIGLAMQNFQDFNENFPLPFGESTKAPTSWRVSILPYAEHQSLYDQYDQQENWDSEPNLRLAETRIANMNCPSNLQKERDSNGRYFTAMDVTSPLILFRRATAHSSETTSLGIRVMRPLVRQTRSWWSKHVDRTSFGLSHAMLI